MDIAKRFGSPKGKYILAVTHSAILSVLPPIIVDHIADKVGLPGIPLLSQSQILIQQRLRVGHLTVQHNLLDLIGDLLSIKHYLTGV